MVKANIEAVMAARLDHGWSLSELARRVEVTNQTIARIENGHSVLPGTAKKVADALGRSVSELFTIS